MFAAISASPIAWTRLVAGCALAMLLCVAACSLGAEDPDTGGAWVGTITTEGNVTTVVNESGSVWGGSATLVEEASIGVDAGPDEHMLAAPESLYATEDEIYIVERNLGTVRVYDFDGTYLRSFGRDGQGPGELRGPSFVVVGPDRRVYVTNPGNQRISVYGPDGVLVDEMPWAGRATCCLIPLAIGSDGSAWVEVTERHPDSASPQRGVLRHTTEGPVGDIRLFPEIEFDRRVMRMGEREVSGVPFAAYQSWSLSSEGTLITGANDRYEYRLISPDGATTVVRRFWDPVLVTPEELDWHRRYTFAGYRRLAEELGDRYELDWDGDNIPAHKPAYVSFAPTTTGGVWLFRHGPDAPSDCEMTPEAAAAESDFTLWQDCSFPSLTIDAFDRDGRYLGEVTGLNMWLRTPFVGSDTVLNIEQDEAGTVFVKRYRLVLPAGH